MLSFALIGDNMCKDYFELCFDRAIEDIMDEKDVEEEEAESILLQRLEKSSDYLDGYITKD